MIKGITNMDTYKIDWKDVVHGSIEIEASSSSEALEKFKSISKGELYKKSNWDTDGKEVKVKFIENKDSPFDAYTPNEMESHGKERIQEWDTFWRSLY